MNEIPFNKILPNQQQNAPMGRFNWYQDLIVDSMSSTASVVNGGVCVLAMERGRPQTLRQQ